MKFLKQSLFVLLIISVLLSIGIITAAASEETTRPTSFETEADSKGSQTKVTYDSATKTMTFTSIDKGWHELIPVVKTGDEFDRSMEEFIDIYRTEVEHVEIGKFDKIQFIKANDSDGNPVGDIKLLQGMTNLKSVHFADGQRIAMCEAVAEQTGGLFADCPNLTTVWFGDDANKIEGCINFTSFGYKDDNSSYSYFIINLFKNCTSVEKIIYPTFEGITDIASTTFTGCASLKEVTIGSNITDIAADAFMNTGVLKINAPEGSTAASVTLPTLLERIEAFKKAGNTAKNYGYCAVSLTERSNVKWEVFNVGTTDVPKYILYFWIDNDSANTKATKLTSLSNTAYDEAAASDKKYIHATEGFVEAGPSASDYGSAKFHEWNSADIPATSISAIVIGDGINAFQYKREVFSGMTGVEVIESPASLKQMHGGHLRGCFSLNTFYTRGNTPVIGTIDLSNFNLLPITTNGADYYAFAGLKSAKNYVFKSGLTFDLRGSCFYDNESLTSISFPEAKGMTATVAGMFTNCYSLKEVTLPSTCTNVVATTFSNCTALEEIVFENGNGVTIAVDSAATYVTGRPKATESLDTNAFKGCTALTTLTAPVGTDVYNFAIEHGFNTTDSYVESAYIGRFTIDGTHLTATDTGYNETAGWRQPNYQDAGLLEFLNSYDAIIETASIDLPAKFLLNTAYEGIFEGMTALREIQFAAGMRIAISGTLDPSTNQHGFFKDCSALTTVWFGGEAYKNPGVVDLRNINLGDMPGDASANILYYMFNGCSAIEKVILPELTEHLNWKGTSTIYPRIWADTFAGCDKLKEVNIPAGMSIIDNGAFDDCTALETIEYYAPASLIGADTFTGTNNGLVIKIFVADDGDDDFIDEDTAGYAAANTINSTIKSGDIDFGTVRAFYKNGISILGYQVRNKFKTGADGDRVDNGLRTLFTINKDAYTGYGYTLVDAGTLTATADTWANYTEEQIKSFVNGGDALNKVVKTQIYDGEKFINKHTEIDGFGASFNVTVIDLADSNIKSEIVSCGYEIWQDDAGEKYIYLTREEAEGYETVSLYKITFAMLTNRLLTLENGDNPINNTLMACAYTEFEPQTGINGYYFADPFDSAKQIAVYTTESTEEITLENIGFDLSEKPNISGMVFGKNVKYDLPLITDEYWQAELDAQLAKIPAGKSFIAFTDFHFEADATRNTRKATELMKYVKTIAGIDTIINLGDTYTGEADRDLSEKVFKTSVGEYYYDVFGTDALYAVGNHESNITTVGTGNAISEANVGLLLPDTVIYENTVKNLDGKVTFDDRLIGLAGSLEFNAFGNYTADDMMEEYLAWAKMHYYYDDTVNGIRYIVYNSGSCGLTEIGTFSNDSKAMWNKVYGTQLEFIYDALKTVNSAYDVVFCAHMMGSATYNDDDVQNTSIYKLLSAFKSGSTLNMTVTNFGNDNMATVIGDLDKTFDFTGNNFTGTVFTIGGHWHVDFSCVYGTEDGVYKANQLYTPGVEATADDAIFWIGLNNDCLEELQSYEKDPTAVTEMVRGTDTENCFNVITITEDGDIVVTRFGAGEDREFVYKKKIESVSYADGISFASEDSYSSTKKIDAFPLTYEAVITLPKDLSGRAGVIFGIYGSGNPNFGFEIHKEGKPRLYLQDADGAYVSVYPNVDVRTGEPVHIAITIENFDSEAQTGDVKCYINGELKTTDTAAALRADFAVAGVRLGGDHREKNEQYFKGSITYAAAYADARTAEEIKADYASFGSDKSDMIFCYDLSSGETGKNITDISGNGYDLEYQYVGFLESKEPVTDYAYSMAVVGDTQKVSINNSANFSKIYDYILNNVESKNIQFVMGLGDITDKDTDAEWELDIAQIKRMDGKVPYSLVRGNHDSKTQFNKYVSYDDYSDDIEGYYEAGSMLNVYYTFEVNSLKYMVMCLDYGADDNVLNWAGEIIDANPDHNVIITTHAYLFRDGTTLDENDVCPPTSGGGSNNGDDIWDKLIKNHENIVLVLSGHDPCREIVVTKTAGDNGNTVTQMLIDPQGVDAEYSDEGGCGLVAMFYFSEDGKTVQVEYYSTIQEKYYMYTNQFTFELDVVSAS